MNKRTNRELLPVRIIIAVAIVAIFAASLFLYFGQETVAMQSAREAYAQFLSENPQSQDKDFIFVYEDTIIIAIRNGKVIRKEYATEADAVSAALNSASGANYSLSGTGDGKLFVVKLFEKTADIYALGTATLPAGADKLTIKVVSNGMIFATFEIPAEAIDRKESPVGVTIKTLAADSNVTLGKNETGFAYDIDVDNLVENNTSLIKVTMNGPKGLSPSMNKKAITVYHKDKVIASTYDPTKGEISFETTDFSPYTFTYQMTEVNGVKDLRKYLQLEESGNIKLTADITINLNSDEESEGKREENAKDYTLNNMGTATKFDDVKYYYAKANVGGTTKYFGSLVIGDMTIDLNGHTITFIGGGVDDAALFAVGNNSSLTIVDSSEKKTGTIKVPYDQHAIWSVDYTSAVSIHGGHFVKEAKSGTQTGRALLYSSGGKINVYAGSSFDFGTDGNGGFNVLDSVGSTRIWIHEGVLLTHNTYCPATDVTDSRVVLVGGAGLSEDNGWYKVQGQKLQVAVPHTDKMLYRVGNKNAFPLRVFFEAIKDAENIPTNVSIRLVDIIATDLQIAGDKNGNTNKFDPDKGYYGSIVDKEVVDEKYKYVANATAWQNGTITFFDTVNDVKNYFSGPVRLELCERDSYGNVTVVYASINLEVIEGYNYYNGADKLYSPSATNGDLCLLEDVTLSSKDAISINGGRALFGNGFKITDIRDTMTYVEKVDGKDVTKDYTYTLNGIVKITNGSIENVKILGYQSKTVGYVSSDKSGYAPTVLISCDANGSANIYNSYIFGGYFPVDVEKGTVLLDNVTLDGGGLANIQILSADVTLRNCTTTTNTITSGKEALGILVCKPTAKIKLEGTLTQHNWLKQTQLPSQNGINFATILSDVYSDSNFAYANYVNMGIVFADMAALTDNFTEKIVDNNNMLTDSTGNKYGFTKTISYSGLTVTGYLPIVEEGKKYDTSTHPKHTNYTPSHYRIYKPAISFDTSENSANKVAESKTQWFKYDASTNAISIGLPKDTTQKVLYLSDLALKRYGYNGTYDLRYSYKDKDGIIQEEKIGASKTEIPLVLSGSEHKLILRAAVSGCTPSGVRDDSVFEVYTYVVPITITTHNFNAPTLSAPDTTGSKHFWIKNAEGTLRFDPDYREALPIYNGISVTLGYFEDENGKIQSGNKIHIDLSECLITPSKDGRTCVASFTTEYDGQLNQCYLTITAGASDNAQFKFAPCQYNTDSKQQMYYYFDKDDGKGGRNKLPTSPTYATFSYQFTDFYGQKSEIVSVKYTFGTSEGDPAGTSNENFFINKNAKIGDSSSGSGSGGSNPCVTPDTLVTLADGTKKEIQYVTYEDQLLVWNFYTGKYDVAPASIVMNHGYDEYKVVTLNFADGTTVNTINGHGFFDVNERDYVILSDNNAADYVGHEFVKVDGNGYTTTKLVSYSVKTEYTESWSIVSAVHFNAILADMWTLTPAEVGDTSDYLTPFDIDEELKFDEAKMQADIDKYGIYAYENVADYLTYEEYLALGVNWCNISVGKGLITWEEIYELLSIHVG